VAIDLLSSMYIINLQLYYLLFVVINLRVHITVKLILHYDNVFTLGVRLFIQKRVYCIIMQSIRLAVVVASSNKIIILFVIFQA